MSLKTILNEHYSSEDLSVLRTEIKFFKEGKNEFPVLYCQARTSRPYQNYKLLSKDDCPLCISSSEGDANDRIIHGYDWLPATWPIKALHGVCYPPEHRAGIVVSDICTLGNFADTADDIAVCINMYGSAASIPVHFHAQIHDNALPLSEKPAFPLLSCKTEPIEENSSLSLFRILGYPAHVLLLTGAWNILGQWILTYLASVNARPNNFVLAPGGRLYVIPRGCEKAPTQENMYGASEMLGLITPVTYGAYNAINNGKIISEALRICGVENKKEIQAIEDHAIWAMAHIGETL